MPPIPTNAALTNNADNNEPTTKWFSADDIEHVDRALDLYTGVEASRFDTASMSKDEERLTCALWVCTARALLEQPLNPSDRRACLWVLHVVKGIAHGRFFVFGLSRDHRSDWDARADHVAKCLRHEQRRLQGKQRSRTVAPTRREGDRRQTADFTRLSGLTVIVIGGEQDDAIRDCLGDVGLVGEWVVGHNIRRVQAVAERIRSGGADGVIFVTDFNNHATFAITKNACRFSKTPMITAQKGFAGITRALKDLEDRILKVSA